VIFVKARVGILICLPGGGVSLGVDGLTEETSLTGQSCEKVVGCLFVEVIPGLVASAGTGFF